MTSCTTPYQSADSADAMTVRLMASLMKKGRPACADAENWYWRMLGYAAAGPPPSCCGSFTKHCCTELVLLCTHSHLADEAAVQGLREWQAFIDCKKTIDVFLAELPLFQSLAHKSMRPRCAASQPVPLQHPVCRFNLRMSPGHLPSISSMV